jgi:hypothetical protein
LIAKVNGPLKVMKLITLTKVVTLKQGNNYVLSAFISIYQAIEKGTIQYGAWFKQKLQNEIIALQ